MEEIVNMLISSGKTISTMESCIGGGLVNAITNVPGSSSVIKFSAVTYSNEFKIKMGVSSDVIERYSVYSIQTANEMSKSICTFTGSDYGVGVTGKLNRVDENNLYGSDNVVFISIYDSSNDKFYTYDFEVIKGSRAENKDDVISFIVLKLGDIL